MTSRVHIVFSDYPADELRAALSMAGRDETVLALHDDLTVGPISPADPALRAASIGTQLQCRDWPELVPLTEHFWRVALADGIHPVLWMSRRCARDYAGFLEFLSRLTDRPCDIADLTDKMIVQKAEDGRPLAPQLAMGLGIFDANEILSHKLFDLVRPLAPAERAQYRAEWDKLRTENAPLRMLLPDLSLASAPLAYFDEALLSYVEQTWRKAARVIGHMLRQFWEEKRLQVGDYFLATRLFALAEAGRIESKGNLLHIRYSEVRLPSAEAP